VPCSLRLLHSAAAAKQARHAKSGSVPLLLGSTVPRQPLLGTHSLLLEAFPFSFRRDDREDLDRTPEKLATHPGPAPAAVLGNRPGVRRRCESARSLTVVSI